MGPNLFYGTGIPACILVLRAKGAKPRARRGKVLFIYADREYREGRAQNTLEPEHIEKIVSAWEAFDDLPGFARVVGREELAQDGDNLNIRRYADNAPPPDSQDVKAHLFGGVPRSEVAAKAELFAAHFLDPARICVARDADYFDFAPDLAEKGDLKPRIEADAGVVEQEAALREAVARWWKRSAAGITELPASGELMALRSRLLSSFERAVRADAKFQRRQTGLH